MKAEWNLPAWYPRAFGGLVISVFFLIALGGSVRIMNAGLACPDWPLCFGDIIPDYHPQVYFEFIHRVIAGLVSIATAVLMWKLFRSRAPSSLKTWGWVAVVLLLTQVVFGGLTVLLQLHSKVVAAHLGMGTAFFGLLLWIYLGLREVRLPRVPVSDWRWKWSTFVLLAVFGQIILGGLVASHFASLVCTDFPTCHGEWFPTFRGIIGLHVIHRLGAYMIFAILLANYILAKGTRRSLNAAVATRLGKITGFAFLLVLVQIGIGIANVKLHTPPLIAVAHLATAALILSMAVRQLHVVNSSSRAV